MEETPTTFNVKSSDSTTDEQEETTTFDLGDEAIDFKASFDALSWSLDRYRALINQQATFKLRTEEENMGSNDVIFESVHNALHRLILNYDNLLDKYYSYITRNIPDA